MTLLQIISNKMSSKLVTNAMRQVQWQVRLAWLADVQFGPPNRPGELSNGMKSVMPTRPIAYNGWLAKRTLNTLNPQEKIRSIASLTLHFLAGQSNTFTLFNLGVVGSSWLRLHSPSNIIFGIHILTCAHTLINGVF